MFIMSKESKVSGCINDTQLPDGTDTEEENGIRYVFRNCPRKFIPKSIFEFLAIYQYYENHSSAPFPAMQDVSARYLFAENYYRSKINEELLSQRTAGGGINA